jgi:hypothetical protein
LELTPFDSLVVSRSFIISPKSLPRNYIKKKNLEHGEEESFTKLCYPNKKEILHSTSVAVKFPSLIKDMRRIKE